MAKAKKLTVKEKMIDLIEHMLVNGWKPNHEWLGSLKGTDVDFEELIFGKTGDYSAHLITEDGKFTAKFTNKRLQIFRKDPKWQKLGNFPVGKVEKIENGIIYRKISGIAIQSTEIIVVGEHSGSKEGFV
ncbi:MAG: hypothetical protein K0R18_76 [Bacillales bacterium]|nr:hypothetical protein [Bacillales bacterium]